jgi:hypothetical protein
MQQDFKNLPRSKFVKNEIDSVYKNLFHNLEHKAGWRPALCSLKKLVAENRNKK